MITKKFMKDNWTIASTCKDTSHKEHLDKNKNKVNKYEETNCGYGVNKWIYPWTEIRSDRNKLFDQPRSTAEKRRAIIEARKSNDDINKRINKISRENINK